jgi:hypothetical protein
MCKVMSGMMIALRKAKFIDSKSIFIWLHEPTTIPWMVVTRTLSFDEPDSWFQAAITDAECLRSLDFFCELTHHGVFACNS